MSVRLTTINNIFCTGKPLMSKEKSVGGVSLSATAPTGELIVNFKILSYTCTSCLLS